MNRGMAAMGDLSWFRFSRTRTVLRADHSTTSWQVNLIANSPDFKNLATTGYWGTYYGKEELVRWSFKLMRSDTAESNQEMLSARCRFQYNPGFPVNGVGRAYPNELKSWPRETGLSVSRSRQ